MKTISIVTPCFNEEAGIAVCYEAVRAVMEEKLPEFQYEHIFIDNCSSDNTVSVLRDVAARDKRVKVIVNARNFGPARSPFHAFFQTSGDAVIPMMADLQTPPELIPDMVRLWLDDNQVVIAVKRQTSEGFVLKFCRKVFYDIMRRFSKVEQIKNYMGYGLYDRCIVEALRGLNEPEPYFRGLVMEVGFKRAFIEYDQPRRRHGKSSYNFFSLADYALLGISTYSRAPLRMMIFAGFLTSILSFLAGLIYLFAKILFWNKIPFGIAPILISLFFLSSIQLFFLGIVGEYIGLLLNYSRKFPLVIEKERINFD